MRRILKIILIIVLVPLAIFLFLVGYATVTDYRPDETEELKVAGKADTVIPRDAVINLMIWNIGYCGLDGSMDFFYDGGKGVRTTEEKFRVNFKAVDRFLQSQDSVDIFMLQEVDQHSKRSYRFNEVEQLSAAFTDYSSFYGKNYDVFFVPVPPSSPMGSVNSGLLSLSRFAPGFAERYSFPGRYGWPTRLFMLDRCFLVMRFEMSQGKQLLVINTHNEAYDDGSIRDQQMAYLKEFMIEEYAKGNYILVGGDWNQCPPGFIPAFSGEVFDSVDYKGIEPDYLPPDWKWIYDNNLPTNRRVDIPYTEGKTRTTVIDFFLLSPNIKSQRCNTVDLDFENSDHQPVRLTVTLQ